MSDTDPTKYHNTENYKYEQHEPHQKIGGAPGTASHKTPSVLLVYIQSSPVKVLSYNTNKQANMIL
jgi:hypothetical protein